MPKTSGLSQREVEHACDLILLKLAAVELSHAPRFLKSEARRDRAEVEKRTENVHPDDRSAWKELLSSSA